MAGIQFVSVRNDISPTKNDPERSEISRVFLLLPRYPRNQHESKWNNKTRV